MGIWGAGGGIYRHVKLVAQDPVSIVPWGVYAPSLLDPHANITGTLDGPQTSDGAILLPEIDVAAAERVPVNVSFTLTVSLYDENDALVISSATEHLLSPGGWARIPLQMAWPVKPPVAGDTVQVTSCDGSVAQQFSYNPSNKAITVNGADGARLCLDAKDAQPTQPPMELNPCSGSATQQWVFNQTTGHILYQGDAKRCLDVFGVTGDDLDVFPCGSEKPSQTFKLLPNAISITRPDSAGVMQHVCLSAIPVALRSHRITYGSADTVQLWNLNRPYLYTLVTSIEVRDAATSAPISTDSVNTTIGVRSAIFDANRGFLLNGLPQKIKGLSMHQDFGGCGTGSFRDLPAKVNFI